MVTLEATNTKNCVNATLFGLSTDEKPIDEFEGLKVPNGAKFFEIDTQNVKFYDAENKRWL